MNAKHQCLFGAILLAVFLAAAFLIAGERRKPAKYSAFIPDSAIILLRSGATHAAVVVNRQSTGPERLDYTWYLRADGKTKFNYPDPSLTTGSVTGASRIVCGPFTIDWSTAGNDGGYVYYPAYPSPQSVKVPWVGYVTIPFTGTEMAVITEPDVAKVDARDWRWKWRRR